MTLLFRPTGLLDLNTDPAAMESVTSESIISSGNMQRCKNLRLDTMGIAKTRHGSTKINQTALNVLPGHLTELSGVRYALGTNIYRNEVKISVTANANKNWSSFVYKPYNSTVQSIFACNAYNRVKIQGSTVYNWGVLAPTFRPTLEIGGTGSINGTVNAKLTYARLEGTAVVLESNPSNAALTSVTLADQTLVIRIAYNALDSIDSQLTHLKLYRTLADGAIYYLDKTFDLTDISGSYDFGYTSAFEATDAYIAGDGYHVAPNALSSYNALFTWEISYTTAKAPIDYMARTSFAVEDILLVSSSSDSGLNTAAPSDHDRPPQGQFVISPSFNGTCFILDDNLLYFSLPKQPEYWPTTYFIEVSPPQHNLISGVYYNSQLFVASKHKIYSIPGSGAQTFFPLPQASITGVMGRYGMFALDNIGIFHVGTDGLYLFSTNAGDRKFNSEKLDRIFRGETVNDVPGVGDLESAWIIQFRSKLYFGYASSSNTYPAHVLVFDLNSRRIMYYYFGREFTCICHDTYNDRLLAADASGFIWHLENDESILDETAAISWEIESQEFTLQTRAHFPRWVKYDIDAASATSATGAIILDGATHQQHTLSKNRNTKRRLIKTGNGSRCSMRVSGTGPIEIYAIESE